MHEAGNQIVDASFTRQRVFEIKTFSSLYLSFMSNEILDASMKQVIFSYKDSLSMNQLHKLFYVFLPNAWRIKHDVYKSKQQHIL